MPQYEAVVKPRKENAAVAKAPVGLILLHLKSKCPDQPLPQLAAPITAWSGGVRVTRSP